MPNQNPLPPLTAERIAKLIDHSLLQPQLDRSELEQGIRDALKYNMAAASVKPCDVTHTARLLRNSDVVTGTVIGFPHGANTTDVKVYEAIQAIKDGAGELDMVMNIGLFTSGDFDAVVADIHAVADAAHEKSVTLKVIFEIHYLDRDGIIRVCQISERAGADHVKTSTGYAPTGASLEAVRLMRETCGPQVKIKAAGGIRTLDDVFAYHAAGADRIATRASVSILEEALARGL